MNGILGSLSEVIYFKNHRDPAHPPGYLMLAPYSEFRTPDGYSREAARTLPEIDRLQRTLVEQEVRDAEAEFLHDEAIISRRDQDIRDRLYARMTSGSCSPYEREFISLWLKLRDEKKRAKYAEIFQHRNMFLTARENDIIGKGRHESEERVNLDKVHF